MKRWIVMMLWLSAPAAVYADQGLSTAFSDVRISEVPLGTPVRVRDLGGSEFVIQNKSDQPTRVLIDVLVPAAHDLRDNALALPDPSWIQVSPRSVVIGPQQSVTCDVIISVPRARKFRHQTYQVMLWSHTQPVESKGMALNVGLLSRLRFTTKKR